MISPMLSPISTVTRVAKGSWMLSIFTEGIVLKFFPATAAAWHTTFLARLLIRGHEGAKSSCFLELGLAWGWAAIEQVRTGAVRRAELPSLDVEEESRAIIESSRG